MGASVRPEQGGDRERAAALWDSLVQRGMSPDSATKMVAKQYGPPPSLRAQSDMTRAIPRPTLPEHDEGDIKASALMGFMPFADEVIASGAWAADRITGGKVPFSTFRDEINQRHQSYSAAHPTESMVAGIAGGVLSGGASGVAKGLAAGTAKLAGLTANKAGQAAIRAGTAATIGAGTGAAYGAGADDENRLRGAKSGAKVGAFTGGVLGAGAEILRPVASKLGGAALNLTARPESDATIGGKINRVLGKPIHTMDDLGKVDVLKAIEQAGATPDDVLAAVRAGTRLDGKPLAGGETLAEIIGQPGVRLARGTHAIPSKASNDIEALLEQRAAQQPTRVKETLEEGLGQKRQNTTLVAEERLKQQRETAKPMWDEAYEAPDITKPEVVGLLKDPAFQDAYEVATRLAHRDGVTLPALDDVLAGKAGIPVRGMDYVKRGLDDAIETGANGKRVIGRTEAGQLRRMLGEGMDAIDADPAYAKWKEARSFWRGEEGAKEALEEGKKFRSATIDDISAEFPRKATAEKDQYRLGALADVQDDIGRKRPDADVAAPLLNTITQDKLRVISQSPEAAERMLGVIDALHRQAKAKNTITGGSPTARIAEETADAHSLPSIAAGIAQGNPMGAARAVAESGLRNRLRGLTEQRANSRAPLLMAQATPEGAEMARVLEELRRLLADETMRQNKPSHLVRAAAQSAAQRKGEKK